MEVLPLVWEDVPEDEVEPPDDDVDVDADVEVDDGVRFVDVPALVPVPVDVVVVVFVLTDGVVAVFGRVAVVVVCEVEAEYGWVCAESVLGVVAAVRRCRPPGVADVPASVREVCCAVGAALDGGMLGSVAGLPSVPMLVRSGPADAWSVWLDPRSIDATVSPPPTSATAVATTARRWFFFHRSRWRRRAARPCDVSGTSCTSPAPSTSSTSSKVSDRSERSVPVVPWDRGSGTSGHIAVGAGARCAPPVVVTGAMSGA